MKVKEMENNKTKQLAVISGKGGTGKTTFTAAFASLSKEKIIADCDVDAPDLHLLLHPEIVERYPFSGGRSPNVDLEKCTKCGLCTDACRFSAIEDGIVDLIKCDHCGVCAYVCPVDAIEMKDDINGEYFLSKTAYGLMVHAKLGIAEENTGKLVTAVRRKAIEEAKKNGNRLIIIDGPPGIGCSVNATITGCNLVIAITEPTLSGMHDLERVFSLTHHFKIPLVVVINKADINQKNREEIIKFCDNNQIEIVGEVPFSREVVDSLVQGKNVIEYPIKKVTESIEGIWEKVKNHSSLK